MWRLVHAIVGRELLRLFRQRGRFLSAMVRPLIWLFVIGAGLGATVGEIGDPSYQRFLVPGVLGMVLLFGAMLVALSVVYDKEFGVMRLLMIAPAPHYWIILAKIVSAVVVSLLQAVAFGALLVPLGFLDSNISPGLFAVALLATAIVCASLGMVVAVYSSTLENFSVVMNFVIFPVFFTSGALYPVSRLPEALQVVAMANPFTYGVDLLKHALLAGTAAPFPADFSVGLDLTVVTAFAATACFAACLRFSHEASAGALGFLRSRQS